MRTLHSMTIFLAACLLFLLEPLVAKTLLPRLGGAPAVWTTCLVFFQGALLAGYAWAHVSVKLLGVRKQAVVQLVVLALPFLVLPLKLGGDGLGGSESESPVAKILLLLIEGVGLPFVAVSATSPLVQRYFAEHDDVAAKDPYFLYAASNVGSFAGLLLYPLVVERNLGLSAQATLWQFGYIAFALLMTACIVAALKQKTHVDVEVAPAAVAPLAFSRKMRWLLLAAIPSSLLSGVTNYLTTDIAPVPLLWMLPLAIYLATFINAFAKRPFIPTSVSTRLLPMGVIFVLLFRIFNLSSLLLLVGGIHVVTFGLASLVAHGRLAEDRPEPQKLTEFFLWVSAGGVLGSSFNALVAPALFDDYIEYRMVLVAALFLRHVSTNDDAAARRDDVVHPFVTTALACAIALFAPASMSLWVPMVVGTLFALAVYRRHDRTTRFGLGVAGLFIAASLLDRRASTTMFRDRNFFGVLKVAQDNASSRRTLSSGTTLHGSQNTSEGKSREPSTYYSRSGPLGDVFAAFSKRENTAPHVAVVGLGTGTIATYAHPTEAWDFFEINPVDVRIATNAGLFTYLSDAFPSPTSMRTILGDARLRLRDEPKASYDMIILDAFNSDAIPVHLLDREAFALYGERLRPDGWLVTHVSNRYLALERIVGALGKDAGRSVACRVDTTLTKARYEDGIVASKWCVVAPDEASLRALGPPETWKAPATSTERIWTDDFSDLLGAMIAHQRT